MSRRKRNSSKINLTISVIFHSVLLVAIVFLAAREGMLGKKMKELTVINQPKEEKKQPEQAKQKPVEPPKPVQTSIESKSVSKQPDSPVPAVTAIVTPQRKHFPWPFLASGLFIIAALGSFALWNARKRARSPGSIITQALPRPGEPLNRK